MNAKIGGAALSVEHKRIEKEKRDAEKAAKEREKLLMKQKTKGGMPPIGSYQAEIEIVAGESVFQGSQFHKKAPPAPQATIQQSWESLVGGAQMINPRDVGELVQKFGVGEDDLVKMVKATQPGRLKTQLLPYQLQVGIQISDF